MYRQNVKKSLNQMPKKETSMFFCLEQESEFSSNWQTTKKNDACERSKLKKEGVTLDCEIITRRFDCKFMFEGIHR